MIAAEAYMKRVFIASLCHDGILGGGIIADDEAIVYKTNKITVSAECRNIVMKYEDIQTYSLKHVFFFPVFTICLKDGKQYTYIVFSARKFIELLKEKGI